MGALVDRFKHSLTFDCTKDDLDDWGEMVFTRVGYETHETREAIGTVPKAVSNSISKPKGNGTKKSRRRRKVPPPPPAAKKFVPPPPPPPAVVSHVSEADEG